jgi:hypothetical protein
MCVVRMPSHRCRLDIYVAQFSIQAPKLLIPAYTDHSSIYSNCPCSQEVASSTLRVLRNVPALWLSLSAGATHASSLQNDTQITQAKERARVSG